MADEVYYSALHWAKKAEASAKQAADLSQTSGKVVQIGFDGTLSNGVLIFKHAPGGTEIPYELVDDVEYEVDLNYADTGSLADTVQIQVKNGSDTINFVSAIHRSSTTPATVGDMKAVMRFDSSTGYRWLFKAAYKITPAGAKVLLLYPVVYNDEAVKALQTALQTADTQNVKLTGNQTIAGTKTYTGLQRIQGLQKPQEFQSPNIDLTTPPSANQSMINDFLDKNGVRIGVVGVGQYPSGRFRTYLQASNIGSMGIGVNTDGTVYTDAPTPPASDNSTQIATTAWTNSRISSIMNSIYPVGSLYLTVNSTCPLATLISGSTWELVSQDRVLQGAGTRGTVGSTLKAGLPNITGNMSTYNRQSDEATTSGSFSVVSNSSKNASTSAGTGYVTNYSFQASRSNSIYGASNTVQPPAYLINVFKRTK